jgi:hypothetical protein
MSLAAAGGNQLQTRPNQVDASQNDVDARRQVLRDLRQHALARVREDEAAIASDLKLVSRRQSLRWMGLAAVAAAAGLKPLRASGEGRGRLAARAEAAASGRIPAPQYGVPALPQPSVPYESAGEVKRRWGGDVQTVETRPALADEFHWTHDYVTLIPADGKARQWTDQNGSEAKVIFYKEHERKAHALEAVASHATGKTYIVPGGQSFYVEDSDDLWSFLLLPDKSIVVRKSFFRVDGADAASLTRAIQGFAKKVSDSDLKNGEKEAADIDLSDVLSGKSSPYPMIGSVKASDGKATVYMYGPSGTFTVDWKLNKLVDAPAP